MLNRRIDDKIVTVHELTFGRGRLTVGPDFFSVNEFW